MKRCARFISGTGWPRKKYSPEKKGESPFENVTAFEDVEIDTEKPEMASQKP